MAVVAVAGVAAVPPPTGVIGDVEHLVCSTSETEFADLSVTAVLVKWTLSTIHIDRHLSGFT